MAQLYVYAITDARVRSPTKKGRRIQSIAIDGLFAVCERRTTQPPLNEQQLRQQYSVVVRIAETVPAVLPVRFGSLLEATELKKVVRQQGDVLHRALDKVRNAVQMTLRVVISSGDPPILVRAGSGRQYLERRMKEQSPVLPDETHKLIDRLGPFVVEERRALPVSGTLAIYHLVRRADMTQYRKLFDSPASSSVIMTGPHPPFAFAPELV